MNVVTFAVSVVGEKSKESICEPCRQTGLGCKKLDFASVLENIYLSSNKFLEITFVCVCVVLTGATYFFEFHAHTVPCKFEDISIPRCSFERS